MADFLICVWARLCYGMSWQALAEAHERSMSEVRERMMIERDRAVEREREASSVRLREQNDSPCSCNR